MPLLLLLRNVAAHLVTLHPLDHRTAVVALLRPPGSFSLGSTSASCAYGPAAPSLRVSASQCPRPSLARAETLRSSRPCRVARSSASPRLPPASSHRSQPACLSGDRGRPAPA